MNANRTSNASPFLFAILLSAMLAGCGSGGGGGDSSRQTPPVANPPGNNPGPTNPTDPGPNPDPDPDPDPTPGPLPTPTVSIPVGLPALYIETLEDASVFNNVIGEVIEGSTQTVLQFVPASGEAAIVTTNRSVEFASSRTTLRAFDDDLYVLTTSEVSASVGRYDADNLLDFALQSGGVIPTPRQQESIDPGCFAALGDDIYYKVSWRDAPFPGNGYVDGPVVRVDDFFASIDNRETTTLDPGIGGDSPSPGGFVTDACYFNVDVADGVWYDTEANFSTGEVSFYSRDPQTGEATWVSGIVGFDAVTDTRQVTNFAFDRQMVYFATLNVATQEVEIARQLLFGDFAIETVLPPTRVDGVDAVGISQLDVDDGHVAFVLNANGASVVGLYDPATELVDFMDLGVRVNQLALIYRAQ